MTKVLITEQQLADVIKNYGNQWKSAASQIDINKEAPGLAKLEKFMDDNKDIGSHFTPMGIIKDKVGNMFSPSSDKNVPPSDGSMMHPLGKKYSIGSGFGERNIPVDPETGEHGTSNHEGVDIPVRSGSPVYAPLDGKVVAAYDTSTSGNRCGGFIQLDTGKYFIKFCHLSKFKVRQGDNVKRGRVIALTGGGLTDPMRGTATGPHLHYEIRDKGGLAYNPVQIQPNLA